MTSEIKGIKGLGGSTIELGFIQKGKPQRNSYIERFNRTYREEVLGAFAFETITQTRALTQAWMWVCNNERLYGLLGYMTPTQFLFEIWKTPPPTKDQRRVYHIPTG